MDTARRRDVSRFRSQTSHLHDEVRDQELPYAEAVREIYRLRRDALRRHGIVPADTLGAQTYDDTDTRMFVQRIDSLTKDALFTINEPLVRAAVRPFAGHSDVQRDDLYSVACAELARCILTFDPTVGTTFGTWAQVALKGALIKFVRRNGNNSLTQDDYEAHRHVARHEDSLAQQLGRRPTLQETSDATGVPVERLRTLTVRRAPATVSADEPGVGDRLSAAAVTTSPEEVAQSAQQRLEMRAMVCATRSQLEKVLTARELAVFTRRWGLVGAGPIPSYADMLDAVADEVGQKPTTKTLADWGRSAEAKFLHPLTQRRIRRQARNYMAPVDDDTPQAQSRTP